MKYKHPALTWVFPRFPQKPRWLLLLLISIKRLRVENFMKDFQTGAKQLPSSTVTISMRGAA